MADIKEKIIFDDSDVIKGLNNQFDLITRADKAMRALELSYKEAWEIATKQLDDTRAATEKGTKAIGDQIVETNKAKQSAVSWGSILHGVADEINVMGVNLGGVITNLKAKASAMKSAASATGTFISGLKGVKLAIAGTGIGLLVIAIGSLISFLGKGEKATKSISVAFSVIGAVITVITGRIIKFGDAVVKILSGDFKGAAQDAKDAIFGFQFELVAAGKAAANLERESQKLKDTIRELSKTQADRAVEISKHELAAADQTKSHTERVNELRAASEKLAITNAENVAIAEREYNQIVNLNKERLEGFKDQEAEAAAYVTLRNARVAANESQVGYERKISGFVDEERQKREAAFKERQAQIKEINDALQDQIDKINAAVQSAKLDELNVLDRIKAEEEITVKLIEAQFKLLEEKARAAGKEVDLEKEKAYLIQEVRENSARDQLEIQKKLSQDLIDERRKRNQDVKDAIFEVVDAEIDALEKIKTKLEEIGAEMRKTIKADLDSINTTGKDTPLNGIELLGRRIQKALGFDLTSDGNEQFKQFMDGISDSMGQLFDSMTAGTEAAIDKNKELLDSLQEQEEEANNALDRELERQEAGLANNVEGERKKGEAIKKEREKAEKVADQLRKKQLAAQLLADTASQASSIGVMINNLASNTSLLGPAGIPIFIAVLAGFFSLISKAKASSKKLYKGGSLDQEGITGFVSVSGRTDRGEGRGHSVENSNLVLGGREFVVAEGPAQKYRQTLEAMNEGMFNPMAGLNMNEITSNDATHRVAQMMKEVNHNKEIIDAIQNKATQQHAERTSQAIKEAVKEEIGKLISVIESKPDTYSYSPGDVVVKETKNTKKIIETAKDWRWKSDVFH